MYHKVHLRTQCVEKKHLEMDKYCKTCKLKKPLREYGEDVQAYCLKRKEVANLHHDCTECLAKKQEEKDNKTCKTCGMKKPLREYAEEVFKYCLGRKAKMHAMHDCTECLAKKQLENDKENSQKPNKKHRH